MRLLKVLTVLLATGSVIALVLASRATPRPLTAIAAVQPVMNFGYVRVEGVVTAYPTFSREDKFLSFRVWDGTGELRIMAYRAVVERLLAEQRIPMPGDRVGVEGTLRIRDDEPALILNAAEGLSIETPPATPVDLAALETMALGERIRTTGQVRRVRNVGRALRVISIRNGDATGDVLISSGLPVPVALPAPVAGQWIEVTGAVGEYRGARQVLSSQVSAIEAPAAHLHAIAELNSSLVGRWISVEGAVSDLRPFSRGMRVDVTDGSGATITAVMFDSVWQALPFSTTLSVDDRIQVHGELGEYRGRVELLPRLAADVRLTGSP